MIFLVILIGVRIDKQSKNIASLNVSLTKFQKKNVKFNVEVKSTENKR